MTIDFHRVDNAEKSTLEPHASRVLFPNDSNPCFSSRANVAGAFPGVSCCQEQARAGRQHCDSVHRRPIEATISSSTMPDRQHHDGRKPRAYLTDDMRLPRRHKPQPILHLFALERGIHRGAVHDAGSSFDATSFHCRREKLILQMVRNLDFTFE